MTDDLFLIVGLGNPGPKYSATRHNAGFEIVNLLAERMDSRLKAHKGHADVAQGRLSGVRVILAKPMTFMNLSGGPTCSVANFFKIPVERIIAVHDELDLPFGGLRVKRGGGDGGHNGLKSLTSSIGSKEYLRVRFGIGRPPGQQDPADFVLKEFASVERKELPLLYDRAADAVESLLTNGLERTQTTFNG